MCVCDALWSGGDSRVCQMCKGESKIKKRFELGQPFVARTSQDQEAERLTQRALEQAQSMLDHALYAIMKAVTKCRGIIPDCGELQSAGLHLHEARSVNLHTASRDARQAVFAERLLKKFLTTYGSQLWIRLPLLQYNDEILRLVKHAYWAVINVIVFLCSVTCTNLKDHAEFHDKVAEAFSNNDHFARAGGSTKEIAQDGTFEKINLVYLHLLESYGSAQSQPLWYMPEEAGLRDWHECR